MADWCAAANQRRFGYRGISPKRLVDLCLSVVVDHFNRIYSAASLSPHWVVALDFLAHAYPEEIFRRLKKAGKLKTEYLPILINTHFEKLDIRGIGQNLLRDLISYLRSHDHNILTLKLDTCDEESCNLSKDLLSVLPNLQAIEIDDIQYYLRESFDIKDIGRNCKLLRTLRIKDFYDNLNWINRHDISFILDNCPLLESFRGADMIFALYKKHVTDFEKGTLANLKQYALKYLSADIARYYGYLDALIICSILCPNVSGIKLSNVNADVLRLCSDFGSLKHVGFHWEDFYFPARYGFHDVGDAFAGNISSMDHFLKIRGNQLATFCLSGGCLSAYTLVDCCPNLKSVMLCGVSYQPFSGKKESHSEAKLRSLRILKFEHANCSIEATADTLKFFLSVSENVETLSLLGCQGLTDVFVSNMLKLGMHSIAKMKLDESDISVSPITDILLHGSLQELEIRRCGNILEPDYLYLRTHRQSRMVNIVWSRYHTFPTNYTYPEDKYYEIRRNACESTESDDNSDDNSD